MNVATVGSNTDTVQEIYVYQQRNGALEAAGLEE
jgi:hypothetical protein